jgi:hypothetical protein
LVAFFFFRRYIAYYQLEELNGTVKWARYEVLSPAFDRWLLIFTIIAVIAIICHIFLIIHDKYILREATILGLSLLSLVAVLSLLSIFPFDFSSIGEADKEILSLSLNAVLVGAAAIISLMMVIRLIKFIVRLITKTATY